VIANGNMTSNSPLAIYYWALYNKHVGRINTYLANIDIPYVENESTRQKYKAILEGLRIWHYFRITELWANVPFVLEPVSLADATPPVTPKAEILDKLFTMSEDVAKRLPEDEGTTNAYMFNRYSFKTLVMRYALYNGRYELAARLAKEIMESGKYQLHPAYADLFNYKADKTNK